MKRQFSKKILGKKEGTYLFPYRMSIKIYEKGVVIKPIRTQGIGIGDKWQYQIENQKAIFLTAENIRHLIMCLNTYNTKKEIVETLIVSNEENQFDRREY